MTLQYSVAVRNAQLAALESVLVPASDNPNLIIRTGAPPANCAAARTGTILATVTMSLDIFNAPSGGVMTKTSNWSTITAAATGTAGYFSFAEFGVGGGPVHVQGTVGTSGTDMIVDSVNFTAGQAFSIITFTLTCGNA